MTMVEKVARAMWDIREGDLPPGHREDWDKVPPHWRDEVLAQARAAIAALREPSEAMIEAIAGGIPGWVTRDAIIRDWRNGIDAALREAESEASKKKAESND